MTHELDVEFGRIWKYWYGDPADHDYRRSIPMLRRLVDSGYVPASYALGMAYYDGKGVPKDYQEAYRHLLRAAEADYPDAQNMIGTYFESPPHGDFQGDLIQAAHWYEKAARNGNSSAQYNYARLLRNSQGNSPNSVEAYIWAALSIHCTPYPLKNRPAENLKANLELQLSQEALKVAKTKVVELTNELPRGNSHHLQFWRGCS
jgi:hypothetical protein